jgi:dihydroorotase
MQLPRLIDLHVHLREPGQTHKGDIASETSAALAGGFGLIVAMPNTTPAIDRPERYLEVQELLAQKAALPVIQTAAMTLDRAGREPVDAAALKAAGVIALSDDGTTPQDRGVMREVAYRAAEAGLLLIDHCEDLPCTRRGEIALAERDLELARETGARVHLQHLSARECVALLADAQKDGLSVSGEATPHHLAFNSSAVEHWGTNAKMAPPLREEADRQALIAGVVSGVLGAIATDHAPHTAEEKAQPFDKAPNGIVGLEAAFPVAYTILVASGLMTLEQLLARFTSGPAAILGIDTPKGTFEAELNINTTIDTDTWRCRARNCPWNNFNVQCAVSNVQCAVCNVQ